MSETQTGLTSLVAAMLQALPAEESYPPAGDFHSANTAVFFGFEKCEESWRNDPKTYKEKFRGIGKVAGLALVYGSSWKMFLDMIDNCTEAQAREIYNNFFKNLPVFSAYDKHIVKQARIDGAVRTFIKRVIYIDAIKSDMWNIRAKGERQAKNLPIQGAGAEIIKFFLLRLYNYIKENDCSRWHSTYLHSDYFTRVVSIKESEVTDLLVSELESCKKGNVKVIVVSDTDGTKVIQEFDRSLQIRTSLIAKHNLTVVL
jgi:DNA polymerase I-like protein with 3'-5' exonuclease and polymerase domains